MTTDPQRSISIFTTNKRALGESFGLAKGIRKVTISGVISERVALDAKVG